VTAVCFSSDASELVGSFECDRVVKFDLERLAPAGSFEAGVHLRTWFDPTRARLIAASRWRGWIESLDLATGSRVQSRLSPTSANTALELSPSRALAVTAARDGSVILWSLDGLKEIVVHRAHDGVATDASFSADERWIASSGWDGRVVVLPVDIEGVALAALPAGFDPESVDANDPSVRR
jgi:WD40 repeat protein